VKRAKESTKRPHLNDIRTNNRAKILELLLQSNALSRKDLGLQLNLTNATISRITKELISEGVCCESEPYRSENQLGRYQTDIYINPEGGLVIAICISSLSSDITINDLSGSIRYQTKIPLKALTSPESAVDFISSYIEGLIENKSLKKKKILGAVLSMPGSIDIKTGHLIDSPILKWKDAPIGEELNKRLSCPFRVENIADILCLNHLERNSLNNNRRMNIFLIHVAIAMGASLAIDGRIIRRRDGNESLIGNIPASPVIDSSKPIKRLKEFSSGQAILKRLEGSNFEKNYTHSNIKKRFQFAVDSSNEQKGLANKIFFEAGEMLGVNIMTLTAAHPPDIIVLSGPAMAANAYCDGIIGSYQKVIQGTDIEEPQFHINRISYIEATKNLALREYLCTDIMN